MDGVYAAIFLMEGEEGFGDDLRREADNGQKDVFHLKMYLYLFKFMEMILSLSICRPSGANVGYNLFAIDMPPLRGYGRK